MCLPLVALGPILAGILPALSAGFTAGGIGAGATAGAAAATAGITSGGIAAATTASTVGAIAGGIGGAAGALGLTGLAGLAITGATTGITLAKQGEAARQQAKSLNQQAQFEYDKSSIEAEQRRKIAGSKVEAATIEGERRRGYAQVSGLSPSQVAQYVRDARMSTLRDIGAARQNYEFAARGITLSQKAIGANYRTGLREINSRLPGAGNVALGVGTNLFNTALKIQTDSFNQTT